MTDCFFNKINISDGFYHTHIDIADKLDDSGLEEILCDVVKLVLIVRRMITRILQIDLTSSIYENISYSDCIFIIHDTREREREKTK